MNGCSQSTYKEATANAGPHGIIGKLSPSPLMHDCTLVYATADEIDEECNEHAVQKSDT